jgi:hypothetical protein
MAVCSHCGTTLNCPDHGTHLVEGVAEQCPLNTMGVIWVEVVDESGRHVDGVSIEAAGAQLTTTAGFAQTAPLAVGSDYGASVKAPLPGTYKDTHALPLPAEKMAIAVQNGQIKLVTFRLRAIVNPVIEIAKKVVAVKGAKQAVVLKADKAFSGKGTLTLVSGGDKLRFWKGGTALTPAGGKLEFEGLGQSGVTVEAEAIDFSEVDGVELKWELASDSDAVGAAVSDKMTAVKATLDIHDKAGTALSAEQKQGDGRVVLLQNAEKTHQRAKLTLKCEPAAYTGTLVLSAITTGVSLFDAATDGSEQVLPLEVAVGGGDPAPLYVQGKTVSAAKCDSGFELAIKDVAQKVDHAKVTVMDARLDLYKAGATATAAQVLMTAAEKQDPGRLVLKQSAKFTRQRAKLVLVKLPKDAPCKLKLSTNGTAVKLFPAANEKHVDSEAAVTLPKELAAADVAEDAGIVHWAEGASITALRGAELVLDAVGIEDACDKAFLTVVDLTTENGTDPAPRFLPNKNKHNEAGNHHVTKVKLVHNLGGGGLQWSTAGSKFALSNDTTDTVTLTAAADPSASLDAESLKVVFTPTGKSALPPVEHWMTVVKLVFSESTNQSYGYDDMDDAALATAELHHVSVKKNGSTKVKVTIEGGATSEMIDFKSEDAAKADFTAPASGQASFDLVIDGKNQDKAETTINARVNGVAGPICDGIKVNVYKEKEISVTIARVKDPANPATNLQLAFDGAATETAIREWYKRSVAKINITYLGDVDASYDTNGNGKLDLTAGASSSTESALAAAACTGSGQKVIIVRELSWNYFLGAAATAGDTTITIASGNMAFIGLGNSYEIGSGPTAEVITVQSKAGMVITLAAPLQHDHPTTDALLWPLSGLSGNPIWVQESGKTAAMVQRTIGHEVGHSALLLKDVVQDTNLMHFSAGRTDTRLRTKELPRKYDPFGNEDQWNTCNRS